MGSARSVILNIITYIFITVLAASTIYFYLKTQEGKPTNNSNPGPSNQANTKTNTDKSDTTNKTTDVTTTPANLNTVPAPSSSFPSNPAQTYVVGPGETLSGISSKLNMNWQRIVEINGLSSGDAIKENQRLIIPSYDEKNKKLFAEFKIDIQKATQLQDQASQNSPSSYIDPLEVAKSDSTRVYGLTANDTFTFISKNELEGTAVVNVTHVDSKQYQINLTQPVKKGKDGTWAITQIIPI